jgi:hypothetical protein
MIVLAMIMAGGLHGANGLVEETRIHAERLVLAPRRAAEQMPFIIRATEQFLRTMNNVRSLADEQRRFIAKQVFADIQPLLQTRDIEKLRELRRRSQDERARLIYEGARDAKNAEFARATMTEQWTIAKIELIASGPVIAQILAGRRCAAVENFIRDNLAD